MSNTYYDAQLGVLIVDHAETLPTGAMDFLSKQAALVHKHLLLVTGQYHNVTAEAGTEALQRIVKGLVDDAKG